MPLMLGHLFKSYLLFVFCVYAAVTTAQVDQNKNDAHRRTKRKTELGHYNSVICNRSIWKSVFEPYLYTEDKYKLDHENLVVKAKYDEALARVNHWKNESLTLTGNVNEACGLQVHLECGENSRCICSTGNVPYSYETKEPGICLAKRGSKCYDESDCSGGLVCQDRYCGGVAAFLDELKKVVEKLVQDSNSENGVSNSISTGVVFSICLVISTGILQ